MTDTVGMLVLGLFGLVALLVLRRRVPVAFWWLVGYPLVALRVLTTYRTTMDACGLTVPAHG
jgi:S-DNA-T family DNA segregation ATPase FtsK/SpoIIIE